MYNSQENMYNTSHSRLNNEPSICQSNAQQSSQLWNPVSNQSNAVHVGAPTQYFNNFERYIETKQKDAVFGYYRDTLGMTKDKQLTNIHTKLGVKLRKLKVGDESSPRSLAVPNAQLTPKRKQISENVDDHVAILGLTDQSRDQKS